MSTTLDLPEVPSWHRLPAVVQPLFIYILLPVIHPLSLWRCLVKWHAVTFDNCKRIALLSVAGFFLFVGVASSPNWLRVYAVSMPGVIVLTWMAGRTGRIRRYVVGLIWIGIACLGLRQTGFRHHNEHVVAVLPAGKVVAPPQAYEKLQWMQQHTQRGNFFFQVAWHVPFSGVAQLGVPGCSGDVRADSPGVC